MAKRTIRDEEITNLNQDWGGTNPDGTEWGMKKERVEAFLKAKLQDHETSIASKVSGAQVNNVPAQKDPNGNIILSIPTVSKDLTNTSNPNAAEAGEVAKQLNAVRSSLIRSIRLGAVSADGSEVELNFYNEEGNIIQELTVSIPAAQEVGEVIYPVINVERLSPQRVKLGDNLSVRWKYDCLSNKQEGSVTEYDGTVRVKIQLRNDSGTTTIREDVLGTNITAGGNWNELNIDGSDIPAAGSLLVIFSATGDNGLETKEAQPRTITFEIVSLSLSSSFNPSIGLATNGGYISGDSVTIPYAYSVPSGTTLKAWLNGNLMQTEQISGTSNGILTGISIGDLLTGRNNVQLLAIDSQGLLSNVVSVDFRKAGDNSDFLGLVVALSSDDIDNVSTDMPLPYAYGSNVMEIDVNQFSEIGLTFAAWNSSATSSTIVVSVDGSVTQTLSVGRTQQTLLQRFDNTGQHVMTITMGECTITLGVNVISIGSVTETVRSGYIKNLSAVGRNNSLADREEWGGVTTFTGLNFSSNGWINDTLLLTNGAKAFIDLKPFADYSGDGNGIHQMGLTVEVELMVSQVVERGSTILHCLWDNAHDKAFDPTDASSFPRGIKVATDKASLLFGGTEEIHTTEKVQDSNGNYMRFTQVSPTVGSNISSMGYYIKVSNNVYQPTTDIVAVSDRAYFEGIVCSSSEAQDLFVIRPYGAEMNIAENKWIHLSFVVQPVEQTTYLLGLLYINGVLSRVNRFSNNAPDAYDMRQNTPVGITIDSDKADVRIRTLRYYRSALDRDIILSNYIATLHTAAEMQEAHDRNDVAGTDSNNNATISRSTLIDIKKRGVLTIVKSRKKLSSTVHSDLRELFENGIGKKEDFCADLIKWDPPCDSSGNKIGEGFEARKVNIRIQGTSSVNYPYKNIRLYLAKTNFYDANETPPSLIVGEKTYYYNPSSKKMETTGGEKFKGYNIRGSGFSMPQSVLCAKTDFVDSSLVMNTGGAHLFNDKMVALGLRTPPMEQDGRVRQAIDGIPCDLYAGTSENGPFTYFGQFVLNNEKSKSENIFGMEGVSGFNAPCAIALEALENRYALTLFQSAGQSSSSITINGVTTSFGGNSAENAALENLLNNTFGKAFEFNYPEDTFWTQDEVNENSGSTLATDIQKNAIRRLMSFIYHSVKESNVNMSNPEYGDKNGWTAADKAKWHSSYFREHITEYFDVDYLCTYYLFTEYWASVDQRAKNIIWRTWDGLKWYPTYYDGDTAMSIRNDAFMVYLYNVTRDTYDTERSKFAFEGHDSWLWCLLLANVEYGNAVSNPNLYNRLSACASAFRSQLTLDAMLTEFNDVMMGNWSERQYNYSQKLKYIDTMDVKYYPYTLTGNREAHRTQFLIERSALLDAQYTAGDYLSDTFTIAAQRSANDEVDTIAITSGDLYYFGFRDVQNNWVVRPQRAEAGIILSLQFTQALNATSGQSNVTGASKIRELNFTNMVGHINSTGMNLGKCAILEKLVINSRVVNGTTLSFGGTIALGDTTKLKYIDLTGQMGVNSGQTGRFDLSKHSRLGTVLLSGTGISTLLLPEGSPITLLALPNTLGVLTLRNLPLLSDNNISMEGDVWTNVQGFNFANCPNLSWTELLAKCQNVRNIRIEGFNGRIRSSSIVKFISGWNPSDPNNSTNLTYHGLNSDGTNNNWPQFGGSVVEFIDYVDAVTVNGTQYTFAQMKVFFEKCELTINQAPYSHYIFDDLVDDPANITNEDNKTGYDYPTSQVFIQSEKGYYVGSYEPSGHISRLHDKCQFCVGQVKLSTHKMHVTRLKKTGWPSSTTGTVESQDGNIISLSDANNEGYDIFLYLPKYWYKGVNDYKNAKKHFFLSANDTCPTTSGTTLKYQMSDIQKLAGKVVYYTDGSSVEGVIDDFLFNDPQNESSVYKVSVDGMKQVRFPGYLHPNYGFAFTDKDGNVLSIDHLTMETSNENPADFMNDEGDYDFRNVPENAKFFYFTCRNVSAEKSHAIVVVTDSVEMESIEPDWVEHKAELIGVYQGYVKGMTASNGGTPTSGLRSISGKTANKGTNSGTTTAWSYDNAGNPIALPTGNIRGSAQDYYNLACIRGVLANLESGAYSTVSYETSKDMANLLMVWFGTRDVESLVGRGTSSAGTTGDTNSFGFTDSLSRINSNAKNRMWGLECWTGNNDEFVDNCCVNADSFLIYKKNKRTTTGYSWRVDYYLNILQQDGNERRVKGLSRSQTELTTTRVRFGRFCDIIMSSLSTDNTYTKYYAARQSHGNSTGRIMIRSNYNSIIASGVVFYTATYPSSDGYSFITARLCFQGEIENESDLLID